MELPISSWKKTLGTLGIRLVRNRRLSRRIPPQLPQLNSEPPEVRFVPSATVSMAWPNGASIEGQYQAINLQLSEPSSEPVIIALGLKSESTADSTDFWLNPSVVTFQPGQTLATVIATFWNDDRAE